MRYNEQLNVYVPAGTRERVQAVAERAGQKQSEWLRAAILRYLQQAEEAKATGG